MNDTLVVGLGQPLGDLEAYLNHPLWAEGFFGPQQIRQALAVHQLHDNGIAIVLQLEHVVDLDDRRMVDAGRGPPGSGPPTASSSSSRIAVARA